MVQFKKIIEIKGEDWLRGLSFQKLFPYGGVFRKATNFNPFFNMGYLDESAVATQLGVGTITKTIRVIVPYYNSSSSLAKFYCFADDSKLYDTDGSNVSDVSAEIASGASQTARGANIWRNKFIYMKNTEVRGNALPVASASDVQLLTGLNNVNHPSVTGADGYHYIGNGKDVAKLTNEAGTSGNTTSVAASLETGFEVRDLVNDGRYLVWLADNASVRNNYAQKNRCVVAFWDLAKSSFDQIFEFQDSYIAGAELINGNTIQFITPTGVYVVNVATPPQLVFPFGGSSLFTISNSIAQAFGAVTVHRNILHFGSGLTGADAPVYAYGKFLAALRNIAFQPYTVPSSTSGITALGSNNNDFLSAADTKLYSHTLSSTRDTSVVEIASIPLDTPFKFEFARIVLRSPIASGNSVALELLTANDTKYIKASETKTNSTDPGAKTLIFRPTANGSNDVKAFHEISTLKLTTNVPIYALEVYGTPVDVMGEYE